MELIFDPYEAIVNIRRPAGNLKDIHTAGFDSVLLDFRTACEEEYFMHMTRSRKETAAEGQPFLPDEPEKTGAVVAPLLSACREQKLKISGAMAPVIPYDRSNPAMNNMQKGLAQYSVACAIEQECCFCIVPPLFVGIPIEDEREINMEYYRSFLTVLKEHPKAAVAKFQILLENECRDHSGHPVRGILSDPQDVLDWLTELNTAARKTLGYNAFGFCLNIGHANICGQDLDEITPVLKDCISAVILTDNSGHEDGEYLPFTSASKGVSSVMAEENTNWLTVIRGLREIHYDGPVIFSMADTLHTFPVFIRPQLLVFAKAVADFFVWQVTMEQTIAKYSHIILFGAGNMCRNYMMDYGTKYPPLFTCDNNSKRWGEEFCGLKIESPEKLKDLPENTGIFICNEFYTEIRMQLESMGVTAGIEYYSDRYPNTEARKRLQGLWK